MVWYTHIFVIRVQRIPHGRHDLGHFAETSIGIFTFDRRLGVPEEERVSRYRSGKTKRFNSILILCYIVSQ